MTSAPILGSNLFQGAILLQNKEIMFKGKEAPTTNFFSLHPFKHLLELRLFHKVINSLKRYSKAELKSVAFNIVIVLKGIVKTTIIIIDKSIIDHHHYLPSPIS